MLHRTSCALAFLLFPLAAVAQATPIASLNPFAEMAHNESQSIMIFVAAIAILGVALTALAGRFRWDILIGAVAAIVIIGAGRYVIEFYNQDNTSDTIATGITNRATSSLGGVERIAFGLACLTTLALGTLAFFGKFRWSWLFAIVGGLVIITSIRLVYGWLAGYAPI